jgi:hypothetical protein
LEEDSGDRVLFSRIFGPEDLQVSAQTGGNLTEMKIRLPQLTKPVHIQSTWSDVIELAVFGSSSTVIGEQPQGGMEWDAAGIRIALQENGTLELTHTDLEMMDSIESIECMLPEQCNLVVETAGGGITLEGKIEGNVHISTQSGDIVAGKVSYRSRQLSAWLSMVVTVWWYCVC